MSANEEPIFVPAELVEAASASCVKGPPASRGLPGGNSLSFASPKESKQRKGDPMVWEFLGSEPQFAKPLAGPAGAVQSTAAKWVSDPNNSNLRCSPKLGSSSNSAAPQTIARPDPLSAVLLGPARRVGGSRYQSRIPSRVPGRSRFARPPLPESDSFSKARLAGPSSADGGGVKGGSCLSEASSADPRRNRAAQVAWSEAEGPGQSGRLLFGEFLLATQKKVTCRRATPGLLANH